jgi:hypothetical protein
VLGIFHQGGDASAKASPNQALDDVGSRAIDQVCGRNRLEQDQESIQLDDWYQLEGGVMVSCINVTKFGPGAC